jgi:hypothetical protein
MARVLCCLLLTTATLGSIACDGPADSLTGRRGGDNGSGDQAAPADDPSKVSCSTRGRPHVGFGNTDLVAGRIEAVQGADRSRLKPFSALKTEFSRVTGQTPGSLESVASTFGTPQERWHEEPIASGLTVATSFEVAFEACLGATRDAAEYAAKPTGESASRRCTSMARRFWSRLPSQRELDACVAVAVSDTAAEPDARRRWAYTCASLLSTSAFLTF